MSRRKKNRKLKKRILIIGEGKTEKIYFTDMKEQEETSFVIIPELGKKGRSDFANIFRKAEECAEFYEFVYCVLDLDVICNKFQTNSYDDKKTNCLKRTKILKLSNLIPVLKNGFFYISNILQVLVKNVERLRQNWKIICQITKRVIPFTKS